MVKRQLLGVDGSKRTQCSTALPRLVPSGRQSAKRSNPTLRSKTSAGVAQLGERSDSIGEVDGSNPSARTKFPGSPISKAADFSAEKQTRSG